MARYLSPEWLAEAQSALDDPSVATSTAGINVVIQQEVTDGPSGDVTFHVTIDDGIVRVGEGAATQPTVTFTQDHTTAAAVARGDLSAQGAFMTGRIRVRGDLPALIEHGEAIGRVDDVLAEVRSRTEW